jgi:hypothetical protein
MNVSETRVPTCSIRSIEVLFILGSLNVSVARSVGGSMQFVKHNWQGRVMRYHIRLSIPAVK